jgi:REP element-mobilizing transposase RayT
LADSDIEVPIRYFDYSVMGRRKRPYLPGMVFHLTARTQGREKWFDAPTMDCICEAMAIVQQHTDAKLRAFVIMSNHLHLMLQQGRDPLAAFMQPLLTRVALTVRRRYDVGGHIFGRTYWDGACQDADYLLTLANYIHANPVRAGLCPSPGDWAWSSHGVYFDAPLRSRPVVEPLLGGDTSRVFDVVHPTSLETPPARLDLRDLLLFTLRENAGTAITLEELLVMRGREATRLRRLMIVRAAEAGYPGSVIARALRLSESAVSKVVRAGKLARPRLM